MCVYPPLNNEHQATLQAIFDHPYRSDISWKEVLSLFNACGGSRGIQTRIDDDRICLAVMHEGKLKLGVFPWINEQDCVSPYLVGRIQSFLMSVGLKPSI